MKDFQSEKEKEAFVQQVFARIAKRYDLMNTVLSFNQDQRWRRIAVENLELRGAEQVLDVACGTCGLTIEALQQQPSVRITGLDFSPAMLDIGRQRLVEKGLSNKVVLQEGDAMSLPYEDNSFDCAMSGFALRNVPDIKKVLQEMKRVVKPGGMVVTLELAKPSLLGFKQLFYLYFEQLLPLLGSCGITGETYSWLPESLRRYPHQSEILKLFHEVGLRQSRYRELTGGIVAVHRGIV